MLKGAKVTSVTLIIAGILAVGILLLLFSQPLKTPLTARIVSLEKSSFAAGEQIRGHYSIFLQQGEFIPADSNVTISVTNITKQMSLGDFITLSNLSLNATYNNFYLNSKNISSQGLGYGWPGTKYSYPDVRFRVKIEPKTNNSTLNYATGNSDTNIESINGFSILRFFKKIFGMTGFVVISQGDGSKIIEATCNYNNPFIYGLNENETASIVAGSVSVNSQSVPDNTITLNLENKFLAVVTDYTLEQQGYGPDFLNNVSNEIALDISKLGISIAKPGNYTITIALNYNGHELAKESAPLTITEKDACARISHNTNCP